MWKLRQLVRLSTQPAVTGEEFTDLPELALSSAGSQLEDNCGQTQKCSQDVRSHAPAHEANHYLSIEARSVAAHGEQW
jgi:hypothetical protein